MRFISIGLIAILVSSCGLCGSGDVMTDASADEQLFDFAHGDVKSSVSYRVGIDKSDISTSKIMESVAYNDRFNELSFSIDGKITKSGNRVFDYQPSGSYKEGRLVDSNGRTVLNITEQRDGDGRIVMHRTPENIESDQSFTLTYTYDNKGNLITEESQYWEGNSNYQYTYNENNERVSISYSYMYDYDSTVDVKCIYEITERDNHQNWIKKRVECIEDIYTFQLDDEASGVHTINKSEYIIVRDIKYYTPDQKNNQNTEGGVTIPAIYIIDARTLNVRSAPSSSADVLEAKWKGDMIEVYEIRGGWARISDDKSSEMWVSDQYIKYHSGEIVCIEETKQEESYVFIIIVTILAVIIIGIIVLAILGKLPFARKSSSAKAKNN